MQYNNYIIISYLRFFLAGGGVILPEVTLLTSEHVGCMMIELTLWVVPCPIKKIEQACFSLFNCFSMINLLIKKSVEIA